MTAGLSQEQSALVGLGAAIGSNCEPCLKSYIHKAGEAGLSQEQLRDAVRVALRVKEKPGRSILEVADRLLADRCVPATESGTTDCAAGCP